MLLAIAPVRAAAAAPAAAPAPANSTPRVPMASSQFCSCKPCGSATPPLSRWPACAPLPSRLHADQHSAFFSIRCPAKQASRCACACPALAGSARPSVPRVLINREAVKDGAPGFFSFGKRDALHLGDCDAAVQQLARALGWEKELQKLISGGGAR